MKILIATAKPFAPAAVRGITDILEEAGYEPVLLEKYSTEDELCAAVADVQGLIVRSDAVTAKVLASAPSLRIVVRAGAGYDNVDLEEATRRGVVVMNTPGQNSNAVAELAVGLMIYAARHCFNPATGFELSGRTLGVQAFGNVGRLVGTKAAALGMKVQALDPFLKPEQIEAAGARSVDSIENLYATSDFLSIHIPATPQTVGSIGYDLVSRMPKGAVLVNTARKEVIDEEGLLKALSERSDLRYVTDVAPVRLDEFKAFGDRFFATPKKMGAQTAEANMNAGLAAARQTVDFLANGNRKFQVNK